jgi:hypothetical protein
VSQDVHHLRDVVAEKLVEIHTSYFKIPTNRAKSFVVNLLTRKWGHSIARGWARLLLERLRENVDLPADLKSFATNPDAIDTEDEEEFANALLSHLNPQNLSWAQGFPTSDIRPTGLSWETGPWPGPPLLPAARFFFFYPALFRN